MQVGSLVEYIGGQCPIGRKIFPLSRNTPYLVNWMGEAMFSDGVKPGIQIDGIEGYAFLETLFREIQPPITSEEISELLEQTELETV